MLDIQAIPALKNIVVYQLLLTLGHACFWHEWVGSLTLASLAAGAEGLMIEFHPDQEMLQ